VEEAGWRVTRNICFWRVTFTQGRRAIIRAGDPAGSGRLLCAARRITS